MRWTEYLVLENNGLYQKKEKENNGKLIKFIISYLKIFGTNNNLTWYQSRFRKFSPIYLPLKNKILCIVSIIEGSLNTHLRETIKNLYNI